MRKIFRLKLIVVCNFVAVTLLCAGQSNLSTPEINPPATAGNPECAKNPTLPGCSAMQQQNKMPSSTRTGPDQMQVPYTDRMNGATPQERGPAQTLQSF